MWKIRTGIVTADPGTTAPFDVVEAGISTGCLTAETGGWKPDAGWL